jgi:tetratricopeptide (TPR) repeat protein
MTELRDEILFKQPQSTHLGDCPICLLPLSTDLDKHGMQVCCSKVICLGCVYANQTREMNEGLHPTCPFCRHPTPDTQAEIDILEMKRTEANDPVALREAGTGYSQNGDHEGAIKYWTKAAELGDAGAHYQLSVAYRDGRGVENDEKKELHHLTEAAISGHTDARCNLASYEGRKGRYERAAKHLIIAANLGHDASIQRLKTLYEGGAISKEDFAAALRAHQAALHATKSPQREEAEAFFRNEF